MAANALVPGPYLIDFDFTIVIAAIENPRVESRIKNCEFSMLTTPLPISQKF